MDTNQVFKQGDMQNQSTVTATIAAIFKAAQKTIREKQDDT
jgi:hypothetical protein